MGWWSSTDSDFAPRKPGGTFWFNENIADVLTQIGKLSASLSGSQKQQGNLVPAVAKLTAALIGVMQPQGTLAATTKQPVPTLVGGQTQIGQLVSQAQKLTASLVAQQIQQGAIAATLQPLVSALIGFQAQVGAIAASSQKLTSGLTGGQLQFGTIASALPSKLVAGLNAQEIEQGTIGSAIGGMSSSLTGLEAQEGSIGAQLHQLTSDLAGVMPPSGFITGIAGKPAAALSGGQEQNGVIASALRLAAIATMAGQEVERGTIAAALHQAASAMLGSHGQAGSLTSAMGKAIANLSGSNTSFVPGPPTAYTVSGTYVVPPGPSAIDYALLGGGAGGGGNGGSTPGLGGEGGHWRIGSLVVGVDIAVGATITITIGAGGAATGWSGTSNAGGTGGNTTISWTDPGGTAHTLTATGGVGGYDGSGVGHGPSPHSLVISGQTYTGGADQTAVVNPGQPGNGPGGGASGSGTGGANAGGTGASGETWLYARTGTVTPPASASMSFTATGAMNGTWDPITSWTAGGGSTVSAGEYLVTPATMTATLAGSISFTGAVGTGAKNDTGPKTNVEIVDNSGTVVATGALVVGGSGTATVSWTGPVIQGQLYTVQIEETDVATYGNYTSGSFTMTPA